MSYREILYKNALHEIADIYNRSKYDPDEDLFRSFDIINSLNENQFKSKEWLVKELLPHIGDEVKDIAVLGSWYGLISFLLREKLEIDPYIHNVDSDPCTKHIAQKLLQDTHPDKKNRCIVKNAEDWIFDNIKKCELIINTSCEHMEPEDLRLITSMKKAGAIVCFQGNNYHSIQSHINTHDSLDEFVESLNLMRVFYKGQLEINGYDRYMVIGL